METRAVILPCLVSVVAGHGPGEDLWPALRAVFKENRADLDKACEAALSGPIRFNLEASDGNAMLLPHLTAVTSLAKLLSTRAVVELHDNHRDAAWTNLMAVTRLVTAWDPEPVDFSQMVRYDCTATAYNLTWLALQAEGWGEERLAGLQREWEAVDLLKRLPETAAFSGASMVALCRAERKEPFHLQGIAMKDVILSPRFVWHTLADSWRRFRYRHRGNLATIGRNAAIADFGRLKLTGRLAWWVWGIGHIYFLIGVRAPMLVAAQWFWSYLTYGRGARLITGLEPLFADRKMTREAETLAKAQEAKR